MEGLKLQQPVLVGLGIDGLFWLDGGWAGEAGGANTQRGAPAGSRFEISRTGDSAVRPRQGARLQHEARSPGSQESEVERLSGGRGRTVGTEGAGDGAASGDRVFCTGSVSREGSYAPVRVGAGRGAWVAQLGWAVREGAVRVEAGFAEGFDVAFGGLVGRWEVERVGLGAAVAVGAGLVAVASGSGNVGPGRVGDGAGAGPVTVPEGSGAGLVALSEGSGSGLVALSEGSGSLGGRGLSVAVGVALDVGDVVALADGAGVFGAEDAEDDADGLVPPGGAWVAFLVSGGALVDAVLGGAWVAFLVSGDASAVGLAFLGVVGGASVGLAVLEVVGGASVGRVFTGGVSLGRVLLDGGFAGTSFLGRAVSRGGEENCSAGTSSSTRGAVFR
ncbi:hypothetical protein [Streptosporangium sp. NPDC002721]|uniref:hypothetical protein n=1 Tax=Streptosporangium sp. NPDC002721 TaxID=3366188 RepID=UPI0036C7C64F